MTGVRVLDAQDLAASVEYGLRAVLMALEATELKDVQAIRWIVDKTMVETASLGELLEEIAEERNGTGQAPLSVAE